MRLEATSRCGLLLMCLTVEAVDMPKDLWQKARDKDTSRRGVRIDGELAEIDREIRERQRQQASNANSKRKNHEAEARARAAANPAKAAKKRRKREAKAQLRKNIAQAEAEAARVMKKVMASGSSLTRRQMCRCQQCNMVLPDPGMVPNDGEERNLLCRCFFCGTVLKWNEKSGWMKEAQEAAARSRDTGPRKKRLPYKVATAKDRAWVDQEMQRCPGCNAHVPKPPHHDGDWCYGHVCSKCSVKLYWDERWGWLKEV
jgi:hypothetical protein